jgi:hypothetical protein
VNHRISLLLKLLRQTKTSLWFRVALRNCSETTLLLPSPEIYGLHFLNIETSRESRWGASLLVSGPWRGVTLLPGAATKVKFRVRPSDVARPPWCGNTITNYFRFCIPLPRGDYRVWYQHEVGEDYFDPDSHYRFGHLQRRAEVEQSVLWMGRATSNILTIHRP